MTHPLTRILLVVLAASCASCMNLSQPFPDQKLYAINAGAGSSGAADASTLPDALRVRPVVVTPPFNGIAFMYKMAPERFESDYYNNFLTSPGRLLGGELIRRLSDARVFRAVTDAGSIASTPLALEINVTELYGDYTAGSVPHAVITARIFLLRDETQTTTVLLQKTYSVREPAADTSPDALVAAWGRAYGRMIDELTADLRTATTPEPRIAGDR